MLIFTFMFPIDHNLDFVSLFIQYACKATNSLCLLNVNTSGRWEGTRILSLL